MLPLVVVAGSVSFFGGGYSFILITEPSSASPLVVSFFAYFKLNGVQIVEFISILLTAGSEAAEKELVKLGALQRVLDLFFK